MKIDKPIDFFWVSEKDAYELRKDQLNLLTLCTNNAIAKKNVTDNPNFELLVNHLLPDEIISFTNFPNYTLEIENLSIEIGNKIKSECIKLKNTKIESYESKQGNCKIGKYNLISYKLMTSKDVLYIKSYLIKARNGVMLVSMINLIEEKNDSFIENIEYLYSEELEIVKKEFFTFYFSNKYKEARSAIEKYLSKFPNDKFAIETISLLNYRELKFQDVINNGTKLIAIDPTNINGKILIGLGFYGLKKYSEAKVILNEVITINSFNILFNNNNEFIVKKYFVDYTLANAYLHLGEVANSQKKFNEILKSELDSFEYGEIYYNLGVIESQYNKNNEKAITYYTLGLKILPDTANFLFSRIYLNRGSNKSKNDDLNGAINDYSNALKHNPKYGKVYLNRGLIFLEQMNFKNAISDFTNSIIYSENDNDVLKIAYKNRGYCKIKQKIDGCDDLKKSAQLGYAKGIELFNSYCE